MPNNPLQSSGAISFGDINVELGRARTTQISIYLAEFGTYGEINGYSGSRPNGLQPSPLSEWYLYNHAALPPYQLLVTDSTYSQEAAAVPCDDKIKDTNRTYAALVDSVTGAPVTNLSGAPIVVTVRYEDTAYQAFIGNVTTYSTRNISIADGATSGYVEYTRVNWSDTGIECTQEESEPVSVDSITSNYDTYYGFPGSLQKSNVYHGFFPYVNNIVVNVDPNQKVFNSTDISLATNTINIPSHGFSTGDEVLYTSLANYPIGASSTFLPSALDTTSNYLNIPDHKFQTGDKVKYQRTSGDLVRKDGSSIFINDTYYYAFKYNKDKIGLATTKDNATAGTLITFENTIYTFQNTDVESFLNDGTPDSVYISAGGLPTGSPVVFYGSSDSGFTPGTQWYVFRVGANEIKFTTTLVGPEYEGPFVNLLLIGTGPHNIKPDVARINAGKTGFLFKQEFEPNNPLYVIKQDDNTIKLASREINAVPGYPEPAIFLGQQKPDIFVKPIFFTNQGTGFHTLTKQIPVNTDSDTIFFIAPGIGQPEKVVYSNMGNTAIGGLTPGNTYYILGTSSPHRFKLSETQNGSPVNLTSVGASTQQFSYAGIGINPNLGFDFFSNCGPFINNVVPGCSGTRNGVFTIPAEIKVNRLSSGNNVTELINAGANNIFIESDFYLSTGMQVTYSNQGNTSIGGLTTDTTYYIIRTGTGTINGIDGTYIKLATSLANANAGTAVDITSTGTGTYHTLTRTQTTTITVRNTIVTSVTSA